MDIWNPIFGEELPLQREPENTVEQIVAVITDCWARSNPNLFHCVSFPSKAMQYRNCKSNWQQWQC